MWLAVILVCCTEPSPAVCKLEAWHPCSCVPVSCSFGFFHYHMTIKDTAFLEERKIQWKEISIVSRGQQWDSTKSKCKPFSLMKRCEICLKSIFTMSVTKIKYLNFKLKLPTPNYLFCDCVRKILEETSQMKFGHLIIKHVQWLHIELHN